MVGQKTEAIVMDESGMLYIVEDFATYIE